MTGKSIRNAVNISIYTYYKEEIISGLVENLLRNLEPFKEPLRNHFQAHLFLSLRICLSPITSLSKILNINLAYCSFYLIRHLLSAAGGGSHY